MRSHCDRRGQFGPWSTLGVCAALVACNTGSEADGTDTGSSRAETSTHAGTTPPDGVPTTEYARGTTTSKEDGSSCEAYEGAETAEEAPTSCGDGVVQPGEACDLGRADNTGWACTAECRPGHCGDGVLQGALGEVCDEGEANVPAGETIPYDGCRDCRERGEFCGDGVVQHAAEDCDVAVEEKSFKCDAQCNFISRVVFVTSAVYVGGFRDAAEKPIGIVGANQECNRLAGEGELPGTFSAWLLVGGNDIYSRFPLYEGDTEIAFVRTDESLIAKGFVDLLAGPMQGVTLDESGVELDTEEVQRVWTNVTTNGEATLDDCFQWKVSKAEAKWYFGLVGRAEQATGKTWTQESADLIQSRRRCDTAAHLYCVQDPE